MFIDCTTLLLEVVEEVLVVDLERVDLVVRPSSCFFVVADGCCCLAFLSAFHTLESSDISIRVISPLCLLALVVRFDDIIVYCDRVWRTPIVVK